MTTPWIEIEEVKDPEVPAGPGSSEYTWQALFVCQVEVLPHQEWVKLKWGFNASALFDETLERQRLFLESQYTVRSDFGVEPPDYRTLAFRFINRPGEGLLVAVMGKIHARTKADAMECAMAYYRELKSTFPYDYNLVPALSRHEFLRISGMDILDENGNQVDLVQIKRLEFPLYHERNSPFLQGFWRSGPRAHEQIWRSLAASPFPLMLNISLRGTVLYEKDRERLLKSAEEISETHDLPFTEKTLSALKQWNRDYVESRLVPWKKFFYLQIHLASTHKISQNLFRVIGTSLALTNNGESQPGYQVISPKHEEGNAWRKKMGNLDLIFSGSYLPVSRLSEVADLEEVFSVMRLPYSPPDNGLPDVNFKTARSR
jgi:hypothetical protein